MGSDGDGPLSPHLLVPTVTLVLAAALLAVGLSLLPPSPALSDAVPVVAEIAPEVETISDYVELAASEPAALSAPVIPAAPETPVAVVRTPPPTFAALPTPTPKVVWNGPRTFTFVALGVDQRENEIPRTDTIIIGKVDLGAPRVNMISVPRDLLVEIPGYGRDRINTAYVYGEQFKEPGGGIGLLRRTIQKNFGVNVDHFGLVDFQCFRTAVDSVGGVVVNVPRAIVDTAYPTDDYGFKTVRFDTGLQRMDGDRALQYARTRHSDSDFHRIQRQQIIMAALRDEVLQLRSLPALPSILSGCRNMRSDLGWRDYIDLASSLRNLDRAPVVFGAIDERMVVDTYHTTGAAVLLPRWEPIRALFASSFGTSVTTGTGTTGPVAPLASPSPLPLQPVPGVAGAPPLDLSGNVVHTALVGR